MAALRRWQREALAKITECLQLKDDELFVAACVAAGKTRFSLELFRLVQNRLVQRIIIVTYTAHLVKQWGKAATEYGLNLVELKSNGQLDGTSIPPDAHGYICTYAMMASWPDLHEAFATNKPTLVVFDEIHHLCDPEDNDAAVWGERAKKCFGRTALRLALSGTPFRSKAHERIPFLFYKPIAGTDEADADPDYSYSLGKAVADRVCRRVQFNAIDGEVKWRRDGKPFAHRFSDEVDEMTASERLRFAVKVEYNSNGECKSEALVDMLRQANRKLMDLRSSGHSNAAGLIVASGTDEARAIRSLLKSLTGHNASLVLNDEAKSVEAIADFTVGTSPWIIAVKMISEGVDIDRLRVCVYASTVTKELFFVQVVGRIVRKPESNPTGDSFFYYPADERLKECAKKIEDEIKIELKKKNDEATAAGGVKVRPPIRREFESAAAEEWSIIIASDDFTSEEVNAADAVRNRYEGLKSADLSELLNFVRSVNGYQEPKEKSSSRTHHVSYSDRHLELRKKLQTKVSHLNHLTGQPHNEIHYQLNRAVNIKSKESASIEQLQRMLDIVSDLVSNHEQT